MEVEECEKMKIRKRYSTAAAAAAAADLGHNKTRVDKLASLTILGQPLREDSQPMELSQDNGQPPPGSGPGASGGKALKLEIRKTVKGTKVVGKAAKS